MSAEPKYDLEEIAQYLSYATDSSTKLRDRGINYINHLVNTPLAAQKLVRILTSNHLSNQIRLIAGQSIYRKSSKGNFISSSECSSLFIELINSCCSCDNRVIMNAVYRILARFLAVFLRPNSIVDLFLYPEEVIVGILSELALEIKVKDILCHVWSREVARFVEQKLQSEVDLQKRTSLCDLFSQWIRFIPKENLILFSQKFESLLSLQLILDIAEITQSKDLVPIWSKLIKRPQVNVGLLVQIATVLIPLLKESDEEFFSMSEVVSSYNIDAIRESNWDVLNDIICYWEACKYVQSKFIWLIACIAIYPPHFDSLDYEDVDKLRELRSEVRDVLRLIAARNKDNPSVSVSLVIMSQLGTLQDWGALEVFFHSLSAIHKGLEPELVASILPLVSKLDTRTTQPSVLCSLCLLAHVWKPLLICPEVRQLVISCLNIPHNLGNYQFCSKQDHAAVVALTRCSLDQSDFELISSLSLEFIRKGLTRQSQLILIETIAFKATQQVYFDLVVKFLSSTGTAEDFMILFRVCDTIFCKNAVDSGKIDVTKIMSRSDPLTLPLFLMSCSQVIAREAWIAMIAQTVLIFPLNWIFHAADLWSQTNSTELIDLLSGRLLQSLESLTYNQFQKWFIFLRNTGDGVCLSNREDVRRWQDIHERLEKNRNIVNT